MTPPIGLRAFAGLCRGKLSAVGAPAGAALDPVLDPGSHSGPRSRRAWRCYWRLGGLYLVAFVLLFNATGWIGAQRLGGIRLYLPQELAIPLCPAWIWPYASLYLVVAVPPLFLGEAQLRRLGAQCLTALLIASASFVLLPAELGFVRELPAKAPYRQAFALLFATDLPDNLVPSLHVAVSSLCMAAFAASTASRTGRLALWAWLTAIATSTVLVHQHHLLDVASGFLLAFGVGRLLPLGPVDVSGRGDPAAGQACGTRSFRSPADPAPT